MSKITWTELKLKLERLPHQALIELIKGLFQLSAQNKAWLVAQLADPAANVDYFEECKQKVSRLVYDGRRLYPSRPRFREAKKVISDYKKATNDLPGTLDLLLTYIENGHWFTKQFGDIDAAFYDALISAVYRFAEDLMKLPDWETLYRARFRSRIFKIWEDSGNFGWGYGDVLDEVFAELDGYAS